MELRERITRQNEESVSTEPLSQEQPQTESAPQITHPSDTDPPSRPKQTGTYFALDKNDIFIVMVFSASDDPPPLSTLLAGGMEQVDETTTDWRVFPGLGGQVRVEPGAVTYLQPTVMTPFAVSPLPGYRRVGEPAPVASPLPPLRPLLRIMTKSHPHLLRRLWPRRRRRLLSRFPFEVRGWDWVAERSVFGGNWGSVFVSHPRRVWGFRSGLKESLFSVPPPQTHTISQ
jgi:hypothetical protein